MLRLYRCSNIEIRLAGVLSIIGLFLATEKKQLLASDTNTHGPKSLCCYLAVPMKRRIVVPNGFSSPDLDGECRADYQQRFRRRDARSESGLWLGARDACRIVRQLDNVSLCVVLGFLLSSFTVSVCQSTIIARLERSTRRIVYLCFCIFRITRDSSLSPRSTALVLSFDSLRCSLFFVLPRISSDHRSYCFLAVCNCVCVSSVFIFLLIFSFNSLLSS